ncbi:hypothetical protein KM043_016749 [Ampulex compressa]|nr:hypothetical protein KM043_016749 [Ampulex compressa]
MAWTRSPNEASNYATASSSRSLRKNRTGTAVAHYSRNNRRHGRFEGMRYSSWRVCELILMNQQPTVLDKEDYGSENIDYEAWLLDTPSIQQDVFDNGGGEVVYHIKSSTDAKTLRERTSLGADNPGFQARQRSILPGGDARCTVQRIEWQEKLDSEEK